MPDIVKPTYEQLESIALATISLLLDVPAEKTPHVKMTRVSWEEARSVRRFLIGAGYDFDEAAKTYRKLGGSVSRPFCVLRAKHRGAIIKP